jgi:hypothetical protein
VAKPTAKTTRRDDACYPRQLTSGSEATAGLGNNFDLAGVLADDLSALSTGAEGIVHILPFF